MSSLFRSLDLAFHNIFAHFLLVSSSSLFQFIFQTEHVPLQGRAFIMINKILHGRLCWVLVPIMRRVHSLKCYMNIMVTVSMSRMQDHPVKKLIRMYLIIYIEHLLSKTSYRNCCNFLIILNLIILIFNIFRVHSSSPKVRLFTPMNCIGKKNCTNEI